MRSCVAVVHKVMARGAVCMYCVSTGIIPPFHYGGMVAKARAKDVAFESYDN